MQVSLCIYHMSLIFTLINIILFNFHRRFSSRPSPARRLLWMSSPATPLRTSKPRFRIKKAFHQTSSVSSSPESNSKMAAPSPTTTSRKSQLCTSCSVFVAVVSEALRSSHHSLLSPESTRPKRWSAEDVTPLSLPRQQTAASASVATTLTSAPRKRSRREHASY